MSKDPQINDKVEFLFKGRTYQGTIIRFRIHKQYKLKKMLRTLNLRDDYPTEHEVVEISVPNKGIFTIPTDKVLRVVDSDIASARAAIDYAANLKAHNAQLKYQKKNKMFTVASQHGLLKLNPPALVWVKYKGNVVRQEKLVGFSPSWQVKIQTPYKIRFINPNFVFTDEKAAR